MDFVVSPDADHMMGEADGEANDEVFYLLAQKIGTYVFFLTQACFNVGLYFCVSLVGFFFLSIYPARRLCLSESLLLLCSPSDL